MWIKQKCMQLEKEICFKVEENEVEHKSNWRVVTSKIGDSLDVWALLGAVYVGGTAIVDRLADGGGLLLVGGIRHWRRRRAGRRSRRVHRVHLALRQSIERSSLLQMHRGRRGRRGCRVRRRTGHERLEKAANASAGLCLGHRRWRWRWHRRRLVPWQRPRKLVRNSTRARCARAAEHSCIHSLQVAQVVHNGCGRQRIARAIRACERWIVNQVSVRLLELPARHVRRRWLRRVRAEHFHVGQVARAARVACLLAPLTEHAERNVARGVAILYLSLRTPKLTIVLRNKNNDWDKITRKSRKSE